MSTNESPVVEMMARVTSDAHRAWRNHLEAGTADSPEGFEAYERMRLASRVFMMEKAGRDQLVKELAR
jgi:hypothetical protein